MEGDLLELNGLEATHTVHTTGFWICKGTLTHLNEDGLGNKDYPVGLSITGRDERKIVPGPGET